MFVYGLHTRRSLAVAPAVGTHVTGVSLVGAF